MEIGINCLRHRLIINVSLQKLKMDKSDSKSIPISDTVPDYTQNSPSDKIMELFDELFSYKDVMQQGQYFYVTQCHKQWKKGPPLGGSLTWQQRYDLIELLKWLKENYPMHVNDKH